MKKIFGISIITLLCLAGCGSSGTNSYTVKNLLTIVGLGGHIPGINPVTRVNMASVVVLDVNGSELGKALAVTNRSITLYTSTGYMVNIDWSGNPGYDGNHATVYFSNADCTGSVYIADSGLTAGANSYSKMVVSDGTNFYIPKTANTDGSSLAATAAVLSNKTFGSSTCNAASTSTTLIEMALTTRTVIGLSAAISTPISLTFR